MQDKTIAKLIGFLFITTVIAGTVDSLVAIPLLGTGASGIVANRGQILLGVFLVLYMAMGIIGIALLLKPVIDRHNPVIAAAYLSFRIVECVFLVVGALVSLFLVAASQDPAMSGVPELSRLVNAQAVGIRMSAYQLAMAILGINSLGLCWGAIRVSPGPALDCGYRVHWLRHVVCQRRAGHLRDLGFHGNRGGHVYTRRYI